MEEPIYCQFCHEKRLEICRINGPEINAHLDCLAKAYLDLKTELATAQKNNQFQSEHINDLCERYNVLESELAAMTDLKDGHVELCVELMQKLRAAEVAAFNEGIEAAAQIFDKIEISNFTAGAEWDRTLIVPGSKYCEPRNGPAAGAVQRRDSRGVDMNLFARHGLIERMIDAVPYGWGIAGLVMCILLFLPYGFGYKIRGKYEKLSQLRRWREQCSHDAPAPG